MTIEIKKMSGAAVIELSGRLDTTTAPVLEKNINESISESADLVLDLKGLEYISSAGLRVLLSAQKRMRKSGSMKLKNVADQVMDILEMTGFADILEIE
jgi:anti-sigma B factor antagonist